MKKILWEQYAAWKNDCVWVDLSRELSAETPHWSGFPDMTVEVPFDYPVGFFVHKYTLVSQYGTAEFGWIPRKVSKIKGFLTWDSLYYAIFTPNEDENLCYDDENQRYE